MATTIPFNKVVPFAEFEQHARDRFAPGCKVFVWKDRVVVAKSRVKGAVIIPKIEEMGMTVVVAPQIPTTLGRVIDRLQFPISLVGALAGGLVAGAVGGIIGGSITYFVILNLRHIPSLAITKEVEDAVRNMDGAEPLPPAPPQAEDKLRWYHVGVAVVLPIIGLPWGVIYLFRGRWRSGITMVIISLVLALAMIIIPSIRGGQ